MDRCALFVDAGYALADGAMAVHGTRRRDSVSWDHAGLLKLLAGLARDRTGLPVLRCYWYETAAEGRRTAEHDALAEMPGLKLRLVNALPGRREGIESQLRRDLITLAKSGAITDAFIASANEHIAEIVAEVQDLGLRVVILHIASDSGWTIPLPLRQECDDIVEISGVHLRSYVDLIKGAEPVAADEPYKNAQIGAVTHHGLPAAALPAAALPAPAASYQVQDASEHRQDNLGYRGAGSPELAEARIPPGLAEPRISADYQSEHVGGSAQQSGLPKNAVNGVQPAGSAAASGVPPYSAAPSYPGSIGRQADAGSGYQNVGGYQSGAGAGYQDGVVTSYPNGSAAAAHSGPAHSGPPPSGPPQSSGPAHSGPPQSGSAQGSADLAGAGQSGDSHGRAGLNGAAAGAGPQGSAAGLSGLAAIGYQQSSYQRGLGQGGIDQNGSGQNGTASQGGPGYQAASQNGAPEFGYSVGQQSAVHGGAGSSYQPGGPGQQPPAQSLPGGGHGQPQPAQSQAAHAVPQVQPQNGQSQAAYPLGHGGGQNGVRAAGLPGGFQPGGSGVDPRSRDPYGSGMPPASGAPDPQPPVAGQFNFGVPEASFAPGHGPGHVQGQVPGQQPGAPGQDQPQRLGFGQSPHQGQDGPMAPPAQYQMPQQAPAPVARVQQPVAIALPEAVKAAHAEGFNFGESVGRDAPGLWLEAVLARKPRMPSDLEARLLQGSVLPIDSLLHDEVRHSLRRGFWDALESARR